MADWGAWFFCEVDEEKVKHLQVIFEIKDYEKAKELYIQIKNQINKN